LGKRGEGIDTSSFYSSGYALDRSKIKVCDQASELADESRLARESVDRSYAVSDDLSTFAVSTSGYSRHAGRLLNPPAESTGETHHYSARSA
jgi:hypothetical protein